MDPAAVDRLASMACEDNRIAYALYMATLGSHVDLYRLVGHEATVHAFIENAQRSDGFAFWGWEATMGLVWSATEIEAGWKVLQDLVAQAPSAEVLALIGAGPLEDYIKTHGAVVAERVAGAAGRSSKFARAVCLAHLPATLPEASKALITKAVLANR